MLDTIAFSSLLFIIYAIGLFMKIYRTKSGSSHSNVALYWDQKFAPELNKMFWQENVPRAIKGQLRISFWYFVVLFGTPWYSFVF